MVVYIKFRHRDDIYAINPNRDLVINDEALPPRICGRCGDNLYIPVELPEGAEISIPMGEMYRPFPIENPLLVIKSEPDLPTLAWPRSKLSPWGDIMERRRLNYFYSVCQVDDNWIEILVEDISKVPVGHMCHV